MQEQAKGTFEVERTALPGCDLGDGVEAGHSRIGKQFVGELVAGSVVHMLAIGTGTPGSAAYVAIERIQGSLAGRTGSFCLQHNGIMARGTPTLSITIVPDSGAGELARIRGHMAIDIADGQHFYTLDYSLDD